MSKNNVRIAIRDSTDSHNVAFFDNKAGIKYKSANLQRFLAGSASILTIKYNSKDIDSIRSGCKLAFRYKNRDYWLNVMNFEKKGFEVELTAYSLGLELNNETRGEHKPANAMSIAEYVAYYDPEHALTIGVNEVSDKRIKLEWTGTDTILARLFSVANSFGAELDFSVELNDDYSLKRQVLNIYKKGNLGTNKVSQPVRVGKELKVINYSDNIKELRTAVRATGKDGLTIDGLNKKIYDNNKELLYYSSGMTVYAPQSRDRFPSVGKGSNDNWIVEDLGETQYETKEALWGYLYSEIQKKSVPEITYEVEGAIEAGIGDTQTLIDDIHFEPALYVQARVSELEDDILTGKVTKSTFINFERKYSQIADILLKQVEALAEDAAPYIVRLTTDNGYIFKNGQGTSTITARLEKYSKDIAATWKWVVDNKVVGTGDKLTVKAEQVTNTMVVTVIAYVNGNEVVRDYMTFSNSDDGVGVESIDRHFTSSDKSDGVTIEGAEWSDKPPAPTEAGKYLWAYDEITYTNGTVTTTKPAAVGANFDVDAFRAEIAEDLKDVPNREEFENKIAEELANSKAEIETQIETAKTQAESNAKEYADTINQETAKVAELANAAADEIKADLVNVKNNLTSTSLVANNAQAAIDEAKQDLTEVANELSTAKQDLANSVDAVNTKVDNAKAELTQAKQELTNVASDLNTAKQDLADSVTAVNTKVDGAKAELAQTKQQLTNVANDLSQAKTDLQTAVSAVDTKAANLQSDLSEAKQDLMSHAQQLQTQANAQTELTKRVTTVEKTANGTKTTVNELSKTVAQNGKDITSVTARTKTVEDDLSGTKTTLSQVKTTADSASQKTATLETGLNGLSAKFENLKIGGHNYLRGTSDQYRTLTSDNYLLGYTGNKNISFLDLLEPLKGETVTIRSYIKNDTDFPVRIQIWFTGGGIYGNPIPAHEEGYSVATGKISENFASCNIAFVQTVDNATGGTIQHKEDKLEKGSIATDYSPNEADLEQKVAEYKQNADQNYASLQTTVQNLDGTVQHNKTVADQTAQGFSTRIESLETYKDGESERANAYFESAKTETAKQLTAERTAIAKDYVAKSTYTSDVTGIRNDLSATTTTANTTKTNLANYQARNDKVVASLKSSLQTTDGNVSNLQTKVEAVPGQITSAVSAVEGKIPTSSGGRNLALGTSADWSAGWTSFNGQDNQATGLYRIYNRSFKIGDKVNIRLVLKYSGIVAADGQTAVMLSQCVGNVTHWGMGQLDAGGRFYFDGSDGEIELKGSVIVDEYILKNEYWNWQLRVDYVASGRIQWKEAKAEVGDLPTPWSPAPEDTVEQISNLSSEIKQTADGMTLLATKTELSTAKNELQSGINTATNKANAAQNAANNNAQTISTHTTQISALNTGLQAKVSQTDFNTLSGRVTTAENNITAKANELTSKITSVEGKIPTEIGAVNLFKGSRDFSGSWMNAGGSVYAEDYKGVKIFKRQNLWGGVSQYFEVKTGEEYVFSAYVKSSAETDGAGFYLVHKDKQPQAVGRVIFESFNNQDLVEFNISNEYKRIAIKIKITKGGWIAPRLERSNSNAYLFFGGYKLERGNIATDWTPAPEDTATQISSLSSEIRQTADGMTLLATKTELNSAKNDLQSGITTATNKANAAQNTADSAVTKANAAQSTANNNAQTISTHTTQISALNTGLQAKVSQTDFNTLSGRVTSAENNITAKANELSSKISSVEGKIPTSSGGRNLAQGTSKDWSKPFTQFSGIKNTSSRLYKVVTDGLSVGDTFKTRIVLKYTDIRPASGKTAEIWLQGNGNVTDWNSGAYPSGGGGRRSISGSGQIVFELTDKINADHLKNDYWNLAFRTDWIASGSLQWKLAKAERGMFFTDWSPAPEDTISQINAVSSEIKQTADGMTLLATKTELNSAKSDLQSGINTATNKANAAQNTANSAQSTANSAQNKANSNAQTISTHTTQISALNTGLSAKVSQTDFNTLSGRVTSAENNITAKANELSSKITSVEGKIPTSVGGRNYLRGTSSEYQTYTNTDYILGYPSTDRDWNKLLDPLRGKTVTLRAYIKNDTDYPVRIQIWFTDGWIYGNSVPPNSEGWSVGTGKMSADWTSANVAFTQTGDNATGGTIQAKEAKLEVGNIPSDWSPAPEDTVSQISNLSSEIKQTADGMTLLATKTELNTAKNDLQSGITTATNKANSAQSTANSNAQTISTHTTQISALNTGLQAKVSQTDFNTLSGRVTSAENNITAKANELSSKITSVEGKIPTSVGGRNYLRGTSDKYQTYTSTNYVLGFPSTNRDWTKLLDPLRGKTVTIRAYIKNDTNFPVRIQLWSNNGGVNGNSIPAHSEGWSVGTGKMSADWTSANVAFAQTDANATGGTIKAKEAKLEIGNIPSDWSPAPEDTVSQISSLSSQIQQTADGMTLLATKTELNNAKNELQSGISTATNKANSAQSAANNNAQTISTHTTQISALNTGLQAKVSQTDFNTLSGRVTTAENNITAKANELSSKITSVEGKIPTSVGAVNLFKGSRDFSGSWVGGAGAYAEDYQGVKIFKKQTMWGGLSQYFEVKTGEEYVFSAYVRSSAKTDGVNFYLVHDSKHPMATGLVSSGSVSGKNTIHFELTDKYKRIAIKIKITKDGWIMPRIERGDTNAYLFFGGYKLERGNVATDYNPAPEDTAEQINSLSSEFKQTTDAIKASVSSVQTAASNAQSTANTAVSKADAAQAGVNTLDSTTVKSASLTINADGIVMKAGKSTTDVANAIGSYFAVNQNAINLFSDKINVKGNMIVNGAITSDKIASKSINTAHLNGKIITADVISSNAVTADAIKAGAVTTDKMSANSINGDRITAGTLDAAKIKAGSITASQIASGTITSNQIKAGGISSANIAAGAITGDKIAAGAIDASKIAANAISANMITGGKLNSTNGATVFDLNAGTLTFNNNYGYIQRVASDKVFEITTYLSTSSGSQEHLTSAFNIRKSDNSRQSGVKFTLYNTVENKPTAEAKINADALILYDSQSTRLFSVHGKSTFAGGINFQGWGDIPIAKVHGGLVVQDIGIGSHTKSLLKIVEELCKKAGILWV